MDNYKIMSPCKDVNYVTIYQLTFMFARTYHSSPLLIVITGGMLFSLLTCLLTTVTFHRFSFRMTSDVTPKAERFPIVCVKRTEDERRIRSRSTRTESVSVATNPMRL